MIFNQSIISGYVVLQGIFVIHIPMLIMTCLFVDSPFTMDTDVMDKMFGKTEPSPYSTWFGGHVGQAYAFTIFMHVILASLSLFKTCAPDDSIARFHRAYKSTQLVAVLL